jgi:type I restriction enzyme S subunit
MNAQQLKNAILQEAIEGRLVPQDSNDEPASVLLARIRKEKEQLVKEGKLKKKDLEVKPISEDEIPFEIPESWEWVRLDSLAEIVRGGSPRPAGSPEFYGGKIPFLKVADLTKDDTMYVNTHTATIKEAGLKKTREVESDTLLLTNSGATLGVPKICTFKTTFNDGIAAFLYLIDDLKPYLYWFLCSKTEAFRNINQGTAQPNLNTDIIKSTLFPMPPLEEQRRIIAKIEELLPKVEEYGKAQDALNKLNAELPERLKKSILQEAIEGRLVPQDPNDEPASDLLDKIRQEKAQLVKAGKLKKKDLIETPVEEDEAPFSIPNSWKWVRFGDLVSTSTGKTPARGDIRYWGNKDYSWVSISDMKQGEKIINTKEYVSTKAANDCFHNEISKRGTLIMSFKLTVGRTSILGIDAYHNEAIISIKTYADKENYIRDYLSYILPVVTSWGDSKDAIKGKTLNAKSIYNLLIPLPPLVEQHRIVKKIEQLLVEINKLKM